MEKLILAFLPGFHGVVVVDDLCLEAIALAKRQANEL